MFLSLKFCQHLPPLEIEASLFMILLKDSRLSPFLWSSAILANMARTFQNGNDPLTWRESLDDYDLNLLLWGIAILVVKLICSCKAAQYYL